MKLFAHERWLAHAVSRRQSEVRSRSVLRVEYGFGPDAISLFSAGFATFVPAELISLAGVLVWPASVGLGSALVALGVVLAVASFLRFGQGARAGHGFRAGRDLARGDGVRDAT
jgi:hypothetical protein